jgi:hypothetical protein
MTWGMTMATGIDQSALFAIFARSSARDATLFPPHYPAMPLGPDDDGTCCFDQAIAMSLG